MPVRLHGDQLHDNGGGSLAAKYHARSVDHCEYTSTEGVVAMAAAGTVAVLLPSANYFVKEARKPPIAEFRLHGVDQEEETRKKKKKINEREPRSHEKRERWWVKREEKSGVRESKKGSHGGGHQLQSRVIPLHVPAAVSQYGLHTYGSQSAGGSRRSIFFLN